MILKRKKDEYKEEKENINIITIIDKKAKNKETINLTDYLESYYTLDEKKLFKDINFENIKKDIKKEIDETININNLTKDKENKDNLLEKKRKIKELWDSIKQAEKESKDNE